MTWPIQHCHLVGPDVVKQTLAESKLEHSVNIGGCTIHHGQRYGSPILIVENQGDADETLSAVWYDESEVR